MNAESVESFLTEQGSRIDWQTMAVFKQDVDRLVRCDLNEAERLTNRIEELAGHLNDPVSTAFAQASRARVLHTSGKYSMASELYDRSSQSLKEAGLGTEAAVIRMQQVFAFTQMGRYDDALRAGFAARRVLARAEPVYLAQLETNVGHVYYRLDRYKKALLHYDRARDLLASAGDETYRAPVDFSRSNVLLEMDRHEEALSLLGSALEVYERNNQHLFAAQARFHIAYINFLRGEYNVALANYYQARERLEELGSHQLVAWCNYEIAEILLALNAFNDAIESASLAIQTFNQIDMPYESGQAALTRALAAMGLKQFEQAESDFTRARDEFSKSGNKTFTALIDLYISEMALNRGQAEEAARRADSSLRVFARQRLQTRAAYARLLIARAAYSSGNSAKAARMARLSLRTIEGLFAPGVNYQCQHLLGRIERDRGRRRQALDQFRLAVATIERMRGGIAADEFKATFLRDKIEAYEDAINACLDQEAEESLEEAFRLVESSKSRALADLMARYLRGAGESESAKPSEKTESDTRARLLKLIEELNWYSSHAGLEDDKGNQRRASIAERYRREVKRCERQIAQLFRRMETEGSQFAEIQRMQAASISDLRRGLEADETALEYFSAGDQISVFVVSRDRIRLIRGIASKREIEQMALSLRFQIEKFNFGPEYVNAYFGQLKHAADDYLSKLYSSLFAPIEPLLETERLIVIPHGALHYVPFHALRHDQNYIIDRFEFSYAPSAAVLKLCRSRERSFDPQNRREMVAVGVSHRDTPNIEDEIRALGSIFPGAMTLTGEQATRENLLRLAPQARFLHLASHGYFRRDNPMFSFLKLADSNLNFYSLLDLKLQSEMVTLSACHTGVNLVFPGDELHGLMRGFLYAGAPSLVASLWAVSDSSTAELMSEMYRRIQAGETKRAALRAAQLRVRDDYGHPYYWAPFVLMGNPL